MTNHPQTQPHQRQKKKTPNLTRHNATQPDLTQPPTPHRQPTGMSLPPVRAVDDHRRKPASTVTRPPTPKNRCKIVTKSGQKKIIARFCPTFPPFPLFPPYFRQNTSHHFTVRTTLVHHSFDLVCAQTQPPQRQKRENPTTQPDLDPTYPDPTRHDSPTPTQPP